MCVYIITSFLYGNNIHLTFKTYKEAKKETNKLNKNVKTNAERYTNGRIKPHKLYYYITTM